MSVAVADKLEPPDRPVYVVVDVPAGWTLRPGAMLPVARGAAHVVWPTPAPWVAVRRLLEADA